MGVGLLQRLKMINSFWNEAPAPARELKQPVVELYAYAQQFGGGRKRHGPLFSFADGSHGKNPAPATKAASKAVKIKVANVNLFFIGSSQKSSSNGTANRTKFIEK